MLKESVRSLLKLAGLSVHRTGTVERLLSENAVLKQILDKSPARSAEEPRTLEEKCLRLQLELQRAETRLTTFNTAEDFDFLNKAKRTVDSLADYGSADFADVASWLFTSALSNHRVVHQRFDEGSLLWRAVKASGGPILEVGRAAGGSTALLLAASGNRSLISIDRAPTHHAIVEHVFNRDDVGRRLILHDQTSREPIPETEFGMLFIDADHSYEGVCHDIATFWNQLKSFDGKPPLAAFHDAADNPIAYVPHVRRAVSELLAERGVARAVESWGSMLVIEKLGDLEQDRWFAKQNAEFWRQFANPEYPLLNPTVLRGSLSSGIAPIRLGGVNLLGTDNVDAPSWRKCGVTVERGQRDTGDDNPVRLVRETAGPGEHGIETSATVDSAAFSFSVFLRPCRLQAVRLSIKDELGSTVASADFALGNASRVLRPVASPGTRILDAAFAYRNGYFTCTLSVALPRRVSVAHFAIFALDPTGSEESYIADGAGGFFFNLSSVRAVVEQ